MKGKCIIFSAPSGAGKTTIVHSLLEREKRLEFSVSACSRAPRVNERQGVDYYFFTTEQFIEHIENKDFIEYEEVYPGNFYGTLKSEIERIHAKGNHVLFDIDVMGGLNLKKIFGEDALSIFVMPPSIEVLKERLIKRGSDQPETIQKRIEKAGWEMQFADQFDIIIHNHDINEAKEEALKLVLDFLDIKNNQIS